MSKVGVSILLGRIVVAAAMAIFVVACIGGGASHSAAVVEGISTPESSSVQSQQYTPPQTPAIMATDEERMEYMALNYWRNFNFRDTTTISSRVAESAFARYIQILLPMPREVAAKGMTRLMESALQDSLAFNRFVEIGEKYLYDPNSPLRNEELYIPILEYVIASPIVDKWSKLRPQHQLEMALKNRVGERATDFKITYNDGHETSLHDIESTFTILLFNNPDCPDCSRVKSIIEDNPKLFDLAKVVSVYVDSDLELWRSAEYPKQWINGYDKGEVLNREKLYDLKAIPTLYLLDAEHRIILKDTTIEAVAHYLMANTTQK